MKKYIKPEMVVVELKHKTRLMAGSDLNDVRRVHNYDVDDDQL